MIHGVGFLLPCVAWESPRAAAEFEAVVTSLVGEEGVTDEMLRAWADKMAPPRGKAKGTRRARATGPKGGRARKAAVR